MANESQTERSRRSESADYLNYQSRSGSGQTSSGAKKSSGTGSSLRRASSASGSAKRSGATSHKRTGTTRKSKKKRQQRRILIFAVSFLVFAVLILIGSIVLAINLRNNRCSGSEDPVPVDTGLSVPAATPKADPSSITEDQVITQDVTVNGISLKGKSVRDARVALETGLEERMSSMQIKVIVDEYSTVLTASKIGLGYDASELDQVLASAANASGKTDLSVSLTHDETLLRTSLAELNDQLPNHATNAKAEILWRKNKIKSSGEVYLQPYWSYSEGTNGMAVDTADVLAKVESALSSGDLTAEIRPEVIVSEPAITVDTLKQQTTLRGSFTTTYYFTGSSKTDENVLLNRENRDINISKAVDIMKVITLAPGKSFSYNRKTGSRTEKNGWALANAIYQGSHRPEPGGGVCQLSTTLYNALLMANIEINSRRAHSMPVDYVEKGWDATVDDSHIDFKFTNSTKGNLYIFCYITRNSDSSRKKDIHVEVYGLAFPEGTTYKKRSELVEEIPIPEETVKDKTMFVGDEPVVEREGSKGWIVKTYIDEYRNGKAVKTVYSATTTYEAISKVIRIGTKPDPTASPSPTPKVTATPKPTKTPKPESDATPAPEAPAEP